MYLKVKIDTVVYMHFFICRDLKQKMYVTIRSQRNRLQNIRLYKIFAFFK